MSAAEILEGILIIIEEGVSVESTALVPVVNDLGLTVGYGTTAVAQLGNGVASEVTSLVSYEAGAATGTTAGIGILGMEVGAVGAALAPALGILAGVGLYNLAPNFWTKLSNSLMEAGQTIGGKVIGYFTEDGRVGYSQETIEIIKNAFIEVGIYESTQEFDDIESSIWIDGGRVTPEQYNQLNKFVSPYFNTTHDSPVLIADEIHVFTIGTPQDILRLSNPKLHFVATYDGTYTQAAWTIDVTNYYSQIQNYINTQVNLHLYSGETWIYNGSGNYIKEVIVNNITKYFISFGVYGVSPGTTLFNYYAEYISPYIQGFNYERASLLSWFEVTLIPSILIQPDAIYPEEDEPIPQTFPDWTPLPPTPNIPTIFPVELPQPNITQDPAQNPTPATEPDGNPDDLIKTITDSTPLPQPLPEPDPAPLPQQDPDTPLVPPGTVDPPINIDGPSSPEPNPPDPNTPVEPDTVPFVPVNTPNTNSNKLFTVYNLSMSNIDALGAYLWDNSMIELIKKVWSNPLDGIISLHQVYCPVVTSTSQNIKLGIFDTGISAPIVANQFTIVSCGTLTIQENNKNVTDYSPYASVHMFLPFIGIVELDVDEVMGGQVAVTYSIDVYTGTCLAEITVQRSPDMTIPKILYTFSGNCSQTLPLTSIDSSGLMSSLGSLASVGIATSAGGGLGLYAGNLLGHTVSHELFHVNHSGSISSNAGIMGQRKPYLIIGRRYGYDANGYNEIYGYPANKTVYLSNCSGFVRVKSINLQSKATSEEKDEITSLLKSGVIL